MKRRGDEAMARSVHDRLLKVAAAGKEDFNAMLVRYGIERLLYRLTRTPHAKRFVLKGAALFVVWLGRVHRPTRDLDLLGSGEFDPGILRGIFEDVCRVEVEPDGLRFDPASITVGAIREGEEYHGLRVKLRGLLGTARVALQVDVGFGDAITPTPAAATYPTLLAMPAPRLRMYPRETTIAEKLDAMLERGLKNSRVKDYFDLWMLARHFAFEGRVLQEALEATLKRRGRGMPKGPPAGLSAEFGADPVRARQWAALHRGQRETDAPREFAEVVRHVGKFAGPVIAAVMVGEEFGRHWWPGGPWRETRAPGA